MNTLIRNLDWAADNLHNLAKNLADPDGWSTLTPTHLAELTGIQHQLTLALADAVDLASTNTTSWDVTGIALGKPTHTARHQHEIQSPNPE